MNNEKVVYRFTWDCGRQGIVRGIFAASPEQVQAAIGQRIYFGEILGKHSEIYGELDEEDLEVLTDDTDFIRQATEFGLIPNGYNPLNYLPEDFDDDDVDTGEDEDEDTVL